MLSFKMKDIINKKFLLLLFIIIATTIFTFFLKKILKCTYNQ